ncbi:hypothetical protein [uncultured Anaerovibrio sp.]|uniref:hypothetical protein n=1 Tax=uncultured Anaerovibrio sp. TaxID=361586 RepID=UPI00261F3D4F|nr:hypothetical protein [uncultured Anaerovibrio sp.]
MYLCKFDLEGKRVATVVDGIHFKNKKEKKVYTDRGYIETSAEDYAYYVGNRGTGANGTGYVRGSDGKPVSAPPYTPTKDEKLARLESEYQQEKAKLEGYFNTALLMDDTETQEELRSEMADLADWYAEEKKAIID